MHTQDTHTHTHASHPDNIGVEADRVSMRAWYETRQTKITHWPKPLNNKRTQQPWETKEEIKADEGEGS